MSGSLRGNAGVSFSKMRVLGSYALVFLTRGSGRYQIRGYEARTCQAGELLVVFPDLAHGYGPGPGEVWDEIYLVFQGAVFDLWRHCGILSPERAILRLPSVRRTVGELRKISAAKGGHGLSRNLDAVCRLQMFLADALSRQHDNGSGAWQAAWPAWMEDAVSKMEADPSASLERVARAVGLSYESFRKKFRAIAGRSPAAFQSGIAMDHARRWMYEERLSNKEIAERLGFCDEFHFSRRFGQITGQTPRDFRRSLPGSGL